MNGYRHLIRPALFRCDPEFIHNVSIRTCQIAGSLPPARWISDALWGGADDPKLAVDLDGVHYANPLGLAAGYDKSGRALRLLERIGFGHVEIGSISAEFSHGNLRPRLWRLIEDEAIVVHYGLPNDGAAAVAKRLSRTPHGRPLGVNIVKTNKGIDAAPDPVDAIIGDYCTSVKLLAPHADYLMVNLSCPNTEMGRDHFADPRRIRELLTEFAAVGFHCPLYLKLSPLGGSAARERILEAVDGFEFVKGFAFNLAAQRPAGLRSDPARLEAIPGAIAGAPVRTQMNECIADLYRRMDPSRYHIIGIGGVDSAEDAYEKIRLGASLVQLLTGMIYQGPGLLRQIKRGLLDLLMRDGFSCVREAVGTAQKSD